MPETVLCTQGLTKFYGDLKAVDDLTLEVFQGEVFGLLGPNGAGKTTTINMICGLLRPDAGKVRIHDMLMVSRDIAVRSRVGLCPQEVVLWEKLTCIEQLQFIGQMYGVMGTLACQRGEALLETLGLTDKRNKLARTLSSGMKRRLNLAMALVHDPELVILDEPEAGLDPQSRVMVREYIISLARTKTVILTTHNMDEAERVADRVAIIDYGKLLVLDTPDMLKHYVGEGDVLEVTLDRKSSSDRAYEILVNLYGSIKVDRADGSLVIRSQDIILLLPKILDTLTEAGLQIGEVRLRENTLEDVFIHLTGRRLRE